MFKLVEIYRFKAPVTVRIPSDDGVEVQTFTALFRALSRDEAIALGAAAAEPDRDPIGDPAARLRAIADRDMTEIAAVLEGWEDVLDADGAPIAFSAEALRQACQWGWFRQGVMDAYGKAMAGEARVGN